MTEEDCQECSGTGCELTFDDGRWYVEGDCESCGGTGERVVKEESND